MSKVSKENSKSHALSTLSNLNQTLSLHYFPLLCEAQKILQIFLNYFMKLAMDHNFQSNLNFPAQEPTLHTRCPAHLTYCKVNA